MSNVNNIPSLRFPGFSGEWDIQPLSSFLKEHKTKSDGKCEVHSVSVSKGVVNQVEYLGRSFAASDTSKYNLAKPGDIIYTKSPTGAFPYGIVKQNKNSYNVIVSPLYAVYTPINKYVGYIIDSYFENPVNTNNYLSSLVQKGAKNTIQISNDTFISKDICLPKDIKEQQKIAECLSAVDESIVAQQEKVDALKAKKKGLMQQLFPQDGETTPRLRFPGFTGEWEEKKVQDICDINTGRSNTQDQMNNGPYPFYIRSAIPVRSKRYLYDCEAVITIGDGQIGKVFHYVNGKFDLHQRCYMMSNFKSVAPRYFYYFFSEKFYERAIRLTAKATVDSVRLDMISEMPILLPPTIIEQQKIASCLSSLDETIAAEEQKVEALKTHKKGLMQQLFPQPSK